MLVPSNHKKKLRKLRLLRSTGWFMSAMGLIIIVIGIYFAIDLFLNFKSNEVTNDAQVEQYVSPINIKVPGYIHKIHFTEHQFVNKGDTLLVVDDREYQIRLKEAEASLQDAIASSQVIDASINTSKSNIIVFDSNIEETETRLRKLKTDYTRYQNLLARNATTAIQVEQIKTDLDATTARLNAMKQQKRTAESSSEEIRKKRGNSKAAILRASAALDMAKLNLAYTIITAPCDGFLGRRALEEGQLVNAGQNITYIIPNTQKWIVANFKETQIKNIYIGQDVTITIDAFNNKKFKGKVTEISNATGAKYSLVPADNSTGNFVKIQQRIPVRIELEHLSSEDNMKLAAGMMAIVNAKIKK